MLAAPPFLRTTCECTLYSCSERLHCAAEDIQRLNTVRLTLLFGVAMRAVVPSGSCHFLSLPPDTNQVIQKPLRCKKHLGY